MLRRPYVEEPVSRLAAWSARLGVFSIVVAALSVVIVRSGYLEVIPAMSTFVAALACAALAILLALASSVVIWRHGYSGIGRSVLGFLIGCALLAYPGYLGYRAYKLPPITDITTSPESPPRFDVIARLRPRGTSEYSSARNAAAQRAAYPNVVPLQVLATPKVAYDAVLSVIAKRRWTVVDSRPPSATRRDGSVEAVARSLIMGFRDDIAIRINPLGNGSQIDVRSSSRLGFHDFGSNAARIVALLDDVDDAVAAAKPDKTDKSDEPEKPERKRPVKPQALNR